ncbi:redoxin domain-containing protein [Paraflavitalea pollutisoli]|uniref:redoxin domain-containing protein n=1 Tax=Paraflavitalea pollutisoli TaxID=3034143 RepID=UPI0023EB2163|nr:redoxin domain-containing protein [Paraflavitalea sp. H1-2-19X]
MYATPRGHSGLLQKIRRISLTGALGIVSIISWAQAGTVQPDRPSWGDTLQVSYDTGHAAARLCGPRPLFAKVTAWMQDGSYQWQVLPLSPDGTVNKTWAIRAGTASLTVRFYTLQQDDEAAGGKKYLYDKSTGQPVAGAYWEDFFTAPIRPLFVKERAAYPQHYLGYAKYFNVVSMLLGTEDSRKTIDSLMPELETARTRTTTPAPGLLAALCVGYAKSGRLQQAKPVLKQLFDRYPAAAETDLAFSLYNYEYYKSSGKQVEEDVRQQLKAIYLQFPAAALSGNTNVTYYLGQEKDIPITAFEKALLPRYAAGSLAYYGMDKLPELYIDRGVKPDSAKAILLRVIDDWHTGAINHQYRLSSSQYSMYMPFLLLLLTKAECQLSQYREAALHASAGIALVTGSNYQGNLLPDLLAIRARAYRASGNLNLALEDYKQLYKMGGEAFADSIRAIFAECTLKEKNATILLASLRQKAPAPTTAVAEQAPSFQGVDLHGKPVSLESLKGKTVVINFWSIGCGPCIGEMPELNKLVDKYRNDSNVVFLAITGDSNEHLQQFFKKRRFQYHIVTEAGKVQQDYKIESLPVHLVINKNGTIVNRSVGARADILTYLDGVIRNNP